MLDAENRLMAENLASKVSRLKSVSQTSVYNVILNVILLRLNVIVSFTAGVWHWQRRWGTEHLLGWHGWCFERVMLCLQCWHMGVTHHVFNILVYSGLQFSQCNWSVDWEREEVLHNGPIRPRQQKDLVLHVRRFGCGLLPAVLSGVTAPELMLIFWNSFSVLWECLSSREEITVKCTADEFPLIEKRSDCGLRRIDHI